MSATLSHNTARLDCIASDYRRNFDGSDNKLSPSEASKPAFAFDSSALARTLRRPCADYVELRYFTREPILIPESGSRNHRTTRTLVALLGRVEFLQQLGGGAGPLPLFLLEPGRMRFVVVERTLQHTLRLRLVAAQNQIVSVRQTVVQPLALFRNVFQDFE